jgi:DNA-binding transcriptional regulator YiaG
MSPDEFKTLQGRLALTNAQLAERLGVSPSTVVKLRGGQHPIPQPVALAMRYLVERAGA